MKQFRDLAKFIIDHGEVIDNDRTGVGTLAAFGSTARFDLSEGFPLLTLKKTYWKGVVYELEMFLRGSSDVKRLQDNNVTIWDGWQVDGYIGPMYGTMWRQWPFEGQKIDQLREVVNQIKRTPQSRRLMVSAWNPGLLPDESKSPRDNVLDQKQALAPCHVFYQFRVRPSGKLDMLFYMRSSDYFLGLPFNVASYALLVHLVANECDLEVGELVVTLGDTHIYKNHMEAVDEMLSRVDLPLPKLNLPKDQTIDNFNVDTVIAALTDYQHHQPISAPVAI